MFRQASICFLIFFLLSVEGCKQKSGSENTGESPGNNSEIRGSLEDGAGEKVELEEMGAREYIPVDTVLCNDSGKFTISFLQERIAFYVLRYGPSGYITLLMEPGESIDLHSQLDDKDGYSIKGSPGSALLQTLAAEHKKALEGLGEIARENRELVSSPDYTRLKQKLDLQFDSITGAFQDYSTRFIYENAPSPAILIALYNLYGQGIPVFHPGSDFSVYSFVDSVMMDNYNELEAVQLLHAQVSEAKLLMESDQQSNRLKEGEIAPDFVSSRPDGSKMELSGLKGNYILLSFWASWSKLSREENASLIEAIERYGNMNFRILQVSVDDEKEAWIGAIREDGLEWDHVSDLQRWETPVVDLYGVEKIPFNVLIDPSGKIMDTDLFGEELLNKLNQIFNN
jgi:peroxiredoxin